MVSAHTVAGHVWLQAHGRARPFGRACLCDRPPMRSFAPTRLRPPVQHSAHRRRQPRRASRSSSSSSRTRGRFALTTPHLCHGRAGATSHGDPRSLFHRTNPQLTNGFRPDDPPPSRAGRTISHGSHDTASPGKSRGGGVWSMSQSFLGLSVDASLESSSTSPKFGSMNAGVIPGGSVGSDAFSALSCRAVSTSGS